MRTIARLIVAVVGNALGLYLADRFIPGFHINITDLQNFAVLALILTALNLLLKPLLTLILGPVIVLTLGLGLIVVNALILLLLDFLSPDLTIDTITALLLGGITIGAVNFIFHLARKK